MLLLCSAFVAFLQHYYATKRHKARISVFCCLKTVNQPVRTAGSFGVHSRQSRVLSAWSWPLNTEQRSTVMQLGVPMTFGVL